MITGREPCAVSRATAATPGWGGCVTIRSFSAARADYLVGGLVKTVPAADGGTRLSFTVPDADPATVPPDGRAAFWEADGRHRKVRPELGILRVGPVWAE